MAFTLEQLEAEKARRQGISPSPQPNDKQAFFEKYGKKESQPEQTKEDFMEKYASMPTAQQDYADAKSGIEPTFTSKISDIYEKRKGNIERFQQVQDITGDKTVSEDPMVQRMYERKTAQDKVIGKGLNIAGNVAGGIVEGAFEGAKTFVDNSLENLFGNKGSDYVKKGATWLLKKSPTILPKQVFGIPSVGYATVEDIISSPVVNALKGGLESFEKWKKSDPENEIIADNLESAVNIADFVTMLGGMKDLGKGGIQILKKGEKEGLSTVKEGTTSKNIPRKAGTFSPEGILTRVNRMNPSKTKEFYKASGGKFPMEWAIERGIIGKPEETIEMMYNWHTKSKQLVDKGLESIAGTYTDDSLINMAQEANRIARNTVDTKNISKISSYLERAKTEGLTMQEINDLKRYYEARTRFSFSKPGSSATPEAIQRAENIDNSLREWQFKVAESRGFRNLPELNKETQLSKMIVDSLGEVYMRQINNNAFGLTDYIMGAGAMADPKFFATVIGKKLLSADAVQVAIAKRLAPKAVVGDLQIDLGEILYRSNELKQQLADAVEAKAKKSVIDKLEKDIAELDKLALPAPTGEVSAGTVNVKPIAPRQTPANPPEFKGGKKIDDVILKGEPDVPFNQSAKTQTTKPEQIKVFRGTGENVKQGENSITWVAEDKRVARNYADSDANVKEMIIDKPKNPYTQPEGIIYVNGNDIGDRLYNELEALVKKGEIPEGKIGDISKSIDEFVELAGGETELYTTKVNKVGARDKYVNVLEEMGYDGIIQKESYSSASPFTSTKTGEESITYGIFPKKPKTQATDLIQEAGNIESLINDIKSRDGIKTFSLHETDLYGDDDLFLNILRVDKDKQGMGIGTKAMNDLLKFADKKQKRIILEPALKDTKAGTTSRKRLIKFYKKLGFVENKGANKDFALPSGGMFRNPK